jgi:hypothetical protein
MLVLQAMTTGRERTVAQWEKLFAAAGLVLEGIQPFKGGGMAALVCRRQESIA